MLEVDGAGDLLRHIERGLVVLHALGLVEQGEDALQRGHGGLEDVEPVGDLTDGVVVHRHEREEGDEVADAHRLIEYEAAADDDDDRGGDGADHRDDGLEERERMHDLHVGVEQIAAVVAELFVVLPLAPEELDEQHAADVLGGEGVEAGDVQALLAERVAHDDGEPAHDDGQQRHDDEGDQRQLPADHQSSTPATPTIMNRSATIVMAPAVSSWSRAAMSFVRRVTRRPTGLES